MNFEARPAQPTAESIQVYGSYLLRDAVRLENDTGRFQSLKIYMADGSPEFVVKASAKNLQDIVSRQFGIRQLFFPGIETPFHETPDDAVDSNIDETDEIR